MTTIGDLERTIVFLASNYASAIHQLDGTEERAKETSHRLIAAREEVDTLLGENASLREQLRVAHDVSDAATESDMRTIEGLRAEVRRLKKAKAKR